VRTGEAEYVDYDLSQKATSMNVAMGPMSKDMRGEARIYQCKCSPSNCVAMRF